MRKLLVIGFLILAGCKKDVAIVTADRVSADVTTAAESFHINASGFQATVGRFVVPVIDYHYVSVSGWRNNYEYVRLSLPDVIHIGTFNIVAGGAYSAYFENVSSHQVYDLNVTGSITVSDFTGGFIKGNFQFKAFTAAGDSVVVSNGGFEGDL
jgi:hypothetical protein